MYLPIFYYPIQEDDRATGFLMPIYGSTTTRGPVAQQRVLLGDQPQPGRDDRPRLVLEDRAAASAASTATSLGPGSQGNSRFSILNEHDDHLRAAGRRERVPRPAQLSRSSGDMSQRLPHNLRRGRTSTTTPASSRQQRYNQNIYQATNASARFGGNVTGNWGAYSVSGTADRNDYFQGRDDASRRPDRCRASRSPAASGRSAVHRVYFRRQRRVRARCSRSTTTNDGRRSGSGPDPRSTSIPTLRFPFTKWPFLTFNSSVGCRGTYWTESLNDAERSGCRDRSAVATWTCRRASPARSSTASGTRPTTDTPRS